MYHDQALIPIKTIDFYGGVNVTLGLPFMRTSPDHGTAFAIAGRGVARPDSLIAALRLAGEMAARRALRLRASRAEPLVRDGSSRAAAAARGHRPPRHRRAQAPRAKFPARPQPDGSDRPRGGPARPGTVIEIGPGPGGLTRALLAGGCPSRRRDRARPALSRRTRRARRRLSRAPRYGRRRCAGARPGGARRAAAQDRRQSALQHRHARSSSAGSTGSASFESLTLMFQREVAERLVALPRSKSYGRLSVLLQWLAEPRILFDVPPQRFRPAAQGDIERRPLRPRAEPLARQRKPVLERVTAAAFGQRRKMLRTSLKRSAPGRSAVATRRDRSDCARRGTLGRRVLRARSRRGGYCGAYA